MRSDKIAPYASVIIRLLQDVLYQEDTINWDLLLRHAEPVREYFEKIGIALHIDEPEGYAYLRQPDLEEAEGGAEPGACADGSIITGIPQARALPRLVRRDRLSYHVTLLCVLLRESLLQFDASGSASARLVLSREDIHELLRTFFKERTDETRLVRTFDSIINQVVGLGFLKELTGTEADRYEVRRILRAKISADTLGEIKARLQQYAGTEKA